MSSILCRQKEYFSLPMGSTVSAALMGEGGNKLDDDTFFGPQPVMRPPIELMPPDQAMCVLKLSDP
jgi:hypothetical protein